MMLAESQEKSALELVGRAERKEGRKEGTDTINKLNAILIENGRMDDLEKSVRDKEYQKQLIKELVDENYE